MSNSLFQEAFKEAFKQLLIKEGVTDVAEVLTVTEDTYYGGYCTTCAYEEQTVLVEYRSSDGFELTHTIWDTLSNLIESLLKEWPA
ncbi:hypothetical protein AVV40_gp37 [Mycobacterium phage Swirley]|uniref:Uncharacterized protein n=1 Tax=Mycobacterium phage Swirley TaxID=1527534 RepID=A0A076YPK1_9CAUD|nr:hypothetical protein AVV40_gp37 [Mycobacterium phage Swirley]AIK68922.1 hypothetical protein PBI_SWIRLEY_57 [Mycobacterium phage Swirley]